MTTKPNALATTDLVHLLVDTSVWSEALRRDVPKGVHVQALHDALVLGLTSVFTTGIVVQELLQGFSGPKQTQVIVEKLRALPMIAPTFDHHVAAAQLRNACRTKGVQVGTIDALIAAICIKENLLLLSTDKDFEHIARTQPLQLWRHA